MRPLTSFRTAATLIVFASLGLAGGRALAAEEPRVVAITAKRFEFTPKQITLRAGETVKLRLTSEDVVHGFYSKPLGIDALIVPGQTTEVVLTPKQTGHYTTICDHFCGAGHGGMRVSIVVE